MILGWSREIILERLNKRIDRGSGNNCHIWKGAKSQAGYGVYKIFRKDNSKDFKLYFCHRLIYELIKGPINELHILHSCDNPLCVNPDHLRTGTHAENMKDKAIRKRQPYGEQVAISKLTSEQVQEIRNLRNAQHLNFCHLAQLYKVSRVTIRNVINRVTWKHIP
jgi:HNH endonuclease